MAPRRWEASRATYRRIRNIQAQVDGVRYSMVVFSDGTVDIMTTGLMAVGLWTACGGVSCDSLPRELCSILSRAFQSAWADA